MKRVQLFEFEDFSWFPAVFRSTMTKTIIVLHKLLGTKEVLANLIQQVRSQKELKQIVDIGSGSGGAMPLAIEEVNQDGSKIDLLLTDLHPSQNFVAEFNRTSPDHVKYEPMSVDATDLGNAPAGLKTMVNCFHHMPPKTAKRILKSAQEEKQPFLIYEMAENMVPLPIWILLAPITVPLTGLTSIFFLPFIRPLKIQDLLFTWIIPFVPLFYGWDGQASGPRTYTFSDIEELLPQASPDYTWEMKPALKPNGKKQGYYVLGMPKDN